MEIVEINGRKVYRAVPSSMRPDLLQLTLNAFLDEDAIVRQNVLKYHLYLKVPIPVSTLEKLLSDRDQSFINRFNKNFLKCIAIKDCKPYQATIRS